MADESKPTKGKGKETAQESKDKMTKKIQSALGGLSAEQVNQLLDLNPALASELSSASSSDPNAAADALKRLNLQDIMTGLASSGKNVKDMGAYKFWATQPVQKFGEDENPEKPFEEGPIKLQTVDEISKSDLTPVTVADFAAQALLISAVQAAFPGHGVLGEEDATELRRDPKLREKVFTIIQILTKR